MFLLLQSVQYLAVNDIVADSNAPDQSPWKTLLKQKFALLGFFTLIPNPSLHGIPIDFVEIRQVCSVFKVVRPCIRQRKCPTTIIGVSPSYGFLPFPIA